MSAKSSARPRHVAQSGGSSSPTGLGHPRVMGWVGATALGLGGSNQSLFLLAALMVSQGSGAIPLLVVGLLLSWAALPGWTELVLMAKPRRGDLRVVRRGLSPL